MAETLRTEENTLKEGGLDPQEAFHPCLEGSITLDLSGLSFYRASFYDFMTEEEDLDL